MDNILVLGHKGMVGRAITRTLKAKNYNVITHDGDLRTQLEVTKIFNQKYDYIFICAAKVGGILANSLNPVNFLYDNTMIAMNVDRKSTRLNSSHSQQSRMPSSA